jgi:hypothetical protein
MSYRNNTSLVAALHMLGQCCSSYVHLIEDTRVLLERVQPLDVRHVNQSTNMATHTLSKMAVTQFLDTIWMEDCPLCIQHIVLAEQVSSI